MLKESMITYEKNGDLTLTYTFTNLTWDDSCYLGSGGLVLAGDMKLEKFFIERGKATGEIPPTEEEVKEYQRLHPRKTNGKENNEN